MRKLVLAIAILAGVGLGYGLAQMDMPEAWAQTSDAEAVTVSNEIVRPMAETLRALYYESIAVKNQYGGRLNELFPAGGGDILDGRDTVTTITCDDARKIVLFANTYITAYETEGVAAMTKPCVRPLEVH